MEGWCAPTLVFVLAASAHGGSFIFPGQLDHAEGDACITNTGGTGRCSRSCEQLPGQEEPRKCGIKDSRFLFCCGENIGDPRQPFTDISPPTVNFQCGRNERNAYFFSFPYEGKGGILRPEAELPPPGAEEPGSPPDTPAGYPSSEETSQAIDEILASLPPNAGAAVGGISAMKNAWPWMALIASNHSTGLNWFCGGALINDQWVITALHCFHRHKAYVVRVGEHDYNDDFDFADHRDYFVAETVLYPDYNLQEAYNDLALVKLAIRVSLKKHISPVCLPWGRESDRDVTGQLATLTGWGDTQYRGFPSSVLQEVNVTIFPPAQCDRGYSTLPHYPSTWPRGIGRETVCAGDLAGGRDACQGDSGGPLVTQDSRGRFVLAGVVSKGYGCGHKDYPGLYVNMREPPYLAWIKKVAFATSR